MIHESTNGQQKMTKKAKSNLKAEVKTKKNTSCQLLLGEEEGALRSSCEVQQILHDAQFFWRFWIKNLAK